MYKASDVEHPTLQKGCASQKLHQRAQHTAPPASNFKYDKGGVRFSGYDSYFINIVYLSAQYNSYFINIVYLSVQYNSYFINIVYLNTQYNSYFINIVYLNTQYNGYFINCERSEVSVSERAEQALPD